MPLKGLIRLLGPRRLLGHLTVSHLFTCTKRAVRKLSGPRGAFRDDFRRVSIGFPMLLGIFGGSLASFCSPGSPWPSLGAPPDLETNEKLPCI